MTEESDWSYASKQKLAVVKAIKGNDLVKTAFFTITAEIVARQFSLSI